MRTHRSVGASGGQKGQTDTSELELQVSVTWVPGNQNLGSVKSAGF